VAERTVQQWLDEIEDALDYRDEFAKVDSWGTLEACFYNDQNSYSAVGPNVIYEEGDTLLSSLLVPDPEFAVEGLTFDSSSKAPIVERLANRFMYPSQLNLKAEQEDASVNNYLNGKAIIKIGYDSEWGWEPKYDIGEVDNPLGLSLTQFGKKGERIEYMNTVPGMPWTKAVHPFDFIVPWGTGTNLDEAPWVAHRIIRETSYFKKDKKYQNTTRLEPQMSMRDYQSSYSYGRKAYRDRARQGYNTSSFLSRAGSSNALFFNEVWEIYDKMNSKIYCVCFSHDKFLRKATDSLSKAIGGYPFVAAGFVWSNRHFWTPPLAYFLGQHQKDQYDIHKQTGKQRRINVAKFIELGDALEEGEASKLMSGDVGATVKAKKHVKDPSKIFWPIPTKSNQELLAEAEYSRRNARAAIGFSRNQAGQYDSSSRRTAYEASKVFEGAQTRSQKKEDVTKYMYVETIRKVMQLVFAFWKTPRQILDGQDWVQYTGAKLKGMYEFNCSLQTRSNMSKGQRKFEAFQMLAMLSQFPNINLQRVEQYVLEAANDPAFEGFFQGVPGLAGQSGGGQQQQLAPTNGGAEGAPSAGGSGVPNNGVPT
jgi:hypothetical protein